MLAIPLFLSGILFTAAMFVVRTLEKAEDILDYIYFGVSASILFSISFLLAAVSFNLV